MRRTRSTVKNCRVFSTISLDLSPGVPVVLASFRRTISPPMDVLQFILVVPPV
jgi:hypothetical protein